MSFKDHFSGHADRYTRFRPRYPRELYAFLASLPEEKRLAWDCGTGNGQAAVALAEFFDAVVATDPSRQQIEHATPHANVRYLVAPAEQTPLADASVDLITVAQAVHWFDLDRFYAEVRRVASRGAIIAVWSYALASIDPAIDRIVYRLYEDVLGEYWPPERRLVEQRYTTIPFPFAEVPAPEFSMTAHWSLPDLRGYLGTWSSTQRYLAEHGSDPLELVREDLERAWGSADNERQVIWPLIQRVGRVNG